MFLEHNMFALLAAVVDQDLELRRGVGGGAVLFYLLCRLFFLCHFFFFYPKKGGAGPSPISATERRQVFGYNEVFKQCFYYERNKTEILGLE